MSEEEFDPLSFIVLEILRSRDNEPIKQKILFQKIAFLSLRNFKKWFQIADFKAHRFGPYSAPLDTTSAQLVELRDIVINPKGELEITEDGREYSDRLHTQFEDKESKKMDKELEKIISNVKEDFNDFTTNEILAFIYKSFPRYIEPSIKAEELEYEKLFLKMYEEGKIGISKIAELMDWTYDRAYDFIKQNAKTVVLR